MGSVVILLHHNSERVLTKDNDNERILLNGWRKKKQVTSACDVRVSYLERRETFCFDWLKQNLVVTERDELADINGREAVQKLSD